MNYVKKIGILGIIAGTVFLGSLLSTPSHAESVDGVMARLNAAHGSGALSDNEYTDLEATLDSAKAAASAEAYSSATEAYNLLAPANLKASFDPYHS